MKTDKHTAGKSFRSVSGHIEIYRPKVVVLENSLNSEHADGAASDSGWVVDWFTGKGYTVMVVQIDARLYGSIPRRPRLCWIAYDGAVDRERDRLIQTIVSACRISTVCPIDDYLLPAECWQCITACKRKEPEDRDAKYKQDHMRLFDALELKWPPERQDFGHPLGHIDTRAYEVIYYCHHVFPYEASSDCSLPRHLGDVCRQFAVISGKLEMIS